MSIAELARRTRKQTSSVARIETGEYELTWSDTQAFARVLEVDPADIFRAPRRRIITIGYLGPGGEVTLERGAEIACPPDLDPARTAAIRVRGDSLWPIKVGWIIFYQNGIDDVPDIAKGQLCVVQLAAGRMLVKHVSVGSMPGRFTLSSGGAPIENATLRWASPVLDMQPGDFGIAT